MKRCSCGKRARWLIHDRFGHHRIHTCGRHLAGALEGLATGGTTTFEVRVYTAEPEKPPVPKRVYLP